MCIQKWVLSISTSALFRSLPARRRLHGIAQLAGLQNSATNVVAAGGNGGLGFTISTQAVTAPCAVTFRAASSSTNG